MSNKITYTNKEQYTVVTLAEKYKFTYLNANEIKTVVNAIDDRVVSLEEDFYISFDFKNVGSFSFTADENFKIILIDNSKNSIPNIDILVNASPYVLGSDIDFKDDILITVDATGYVKLICKAI